MRVVSLSAVVSLTCIASAFGQFTAGNLAVLRVGDGSTTLGGLGNNVAILEYSTGGSLANTYGLPNSGAGAIVLTGNATAEGALSLSADSSMLTFAGYNTAPLGSGSLAASSGATVPRAVVQINISGVSSIGSSSATAFSGASFRSAISDGANNYWAIGNGTGTAYFGNTASPANLQTSLGVNRVANFVNGNVAFGNGSAATAGIYGFSGAPTGPATATALILTAGTGTGSASPYDFAFNSGMTLAYIADDRTTANGGGIQRWDFNGTSWILTYTITSGGPVRGLAVDFSGTDPVLYATTTENSNNRLIKITDTGAASGETDLAFAGTTRAFRGLEFAPQIIPEPSTFVLAGFSAAAILIFRRCKK
jgi:hypothetical protein